MTSPDDDAPVVLYLRAAVDSPDQPPSWLPVESCVTCGALVPTVRFDVHGRWHRALREEVTR